jgi:hypothetical protein
MKALHIKVEMAVSFITEVLCIKASRMELETSLELWLRWLLLISIQIQLRGLRTAVSPSIKMVNLFINLRRWNSYSIVLAWVSITTAKLNYWKTKNKSIRWIKMRFTIIISSTNRYYIRILPKKSFSKLISIDELLVYYFIWVNIW